MNRRTITKAVFALLLVAGGIYTCREASREAHRHATNPTIHEIRQAADRPGPRQAIAQAMLAFNPSLTVRRGKASSSGGCEPRPTTVAPVGSSQGGPWR